MDLIEFGLLIQVDLRDLLTKHRVNIEEGSFNDFCSNTRSLWDTEKGWRIGEWLDNYKWNIRVKERSVIVPRVGDTYYPSDNLDSALGAWLNKNKGVWSKLSEKDQEWVPLYIVQEPWTIDEVRFGDVDKKDGEIIRRDYLDPVVVIEA